MSREWFLLLRAPKSGSYFFKLLPRTRFRRSVDYDAYFCWPQFQRFAGMKLKKGEEVLARLRITRPEQHVRRLIVFRISATCAEIGVGDAAVEKRKGMRHKELSRRVTIVSYEAWQRLTGIELVKQGDPVYVVISVELQRVAAAQIR